MRALTKAQNAKLLKLETARNAAMTAIYNIALPRTDVRFSDCCAMATPVEMKPYQNACTALRDFQHQMVQERRAYFDNQGTWRSY